MDDGWGELDIDDASGAVAEPAAAATGLGSDEGLAKARSEFEEQLKASESRSQELQEELENMKGDVAAGSEAVARVAELEKELAQKARAAEEQIQAGSSRIAELEAELAAKTEVAQSSNKDPLAGMADQDDGWGDFDLPAAGAAPKAVDKDGALLSAKADELEAKLKESEARVAELQEQLAVKAEATKTEHFNLDDGWGDLDIDDGPGAVAELASAATGLGSDEALAKARSEFEDQLKASEARSQALQEELENMKDGSAEGTEAVARVAELEKELAQKARAAEGQMQASSSRIAELEAELVAKMEVAQSSSKDPLAGMADQDDGWGDFDLPAPGAAPTADKDGTLLKAKADDLEAKLKDREARIAELQEQLAAKAEASKTESFDLDDGWGGLDIDDASGAVAEPTAAAVGLGPDEGLAKARSEFEEQLRASEARSQALEEALESMKGDIAAGSEAVARVAELEKDLAQKAHVAEEQMQASSSRIAELEAELAAKTEVAQSSSKDPLAGMADQDDGWGDFDLTAAGAATTAVDKDGTLPTAKADELEAKLKENEALAAVETQKKTCEEMERRCCELQERLESSKSSQPASSAANLGDGGGGWGDFDLDEMVEAPPAAVGSAPTSADEARLKSLEADLEESKKQLQGALAMVEAERTKREQREEELAKAQGSAAALSGQGTAPADSDGWDNFELDDFAAPPATAPRQGAARDAEELASIRTRLDETLAALEEERRRHQETESKLRSLSAGATAAHSVSMFSTASKLFGTASSVAEAATSALGIAAAGAEGQEPGRPGEAGDGSREPEGSAARKKLQGELEAAKAKLAFAEEQLQAERQVHSKGAMAALRKEVSELSEALTKERQNKEKEIARLNQLVHNTQEDLRQQVVAASQAGSDGLQLQLEQIRRQRDQARGIAQCIARQVSSLAEELHRLRSASQASDSHSAASAVRHLQQSPASPPEPGGNPEPMVEPELTRDPRTASPSSGMAGVAPADDVALSRAAAVEGSAPRPPDEVTSGWDVFDPDEQVENTIPTAPSGPAVANEGWGDFALDALDPDAQVEHTIPTAPSDPVGGPDDQVEHTMPTATSDPVGGDEGWGDFALDDLA
eukprot:TRINITY_DN3097_c0_g1_i2.p1 TRINITY_DN3097_c0_g1~~TRINITY_DN3097_c0_g1_i2.p1  ORF type:complete len:1218 (-),score=426.75 TRINITY_DN3097_c0_g1_i2:124-3438(-)